MKDKEVMHTATQSSLPIQNPSSKIQNPLLIPPAPASREALSQSKIQNPKSKIHLSLLLLFLASLEAGVLAWRHNVPVSTAAVFSLPMANNAMQNEAGLTAPSILAH